jgi:hypothetical protein
VPGLLFTVVDSIAKREFAVLTQMFTGVDGKVQELHCV